MKYPPLEQKLRDMRFEQLWSRYWRRSFLQGLIALTSVMALLVALFRGRWEASLFVVFACAGLAVVSGVATWMSRSRALSALRDELPPGSDYDPRGRVG